MAQIATTLVAPRQLIEWVRDARERTFEIVSDLTNEQLLGPKLDIVNPLLWEIGHLAWFQEKWALRHALGRDPLREDADALWDSIAIPHDVRWDLPLPSREETLAYMREVRDRVVEALARDPTEELLYHALYALYHEDMHAEAFTYTRQTHGWPAPPIHGDGSSATGGGTSGTAAGGAGAAEGGPLPGDVEVPGGTLWLGAPEDAPFAFDNEQWAHPVEVGPFAIARAPVTQGEFVAFVEAGGYEDPEPWSDDGWLWREGAGAQALVYWRKEGGSWRRRHFDRWVPLEPHRPVIHVSWYEAEAYCRWAGRRLPTEAEWEAAASAFRAPDGTLAGRPREKRRYPWGNEPAPTADHANLDWRAMGCVDAGALSGGSSAFGCRGMIGNVWEWTASDFLPYPGFQPDPYEEYSEPWFGDRKVLRGGCWATRSRLIYNFYRNYYTPDRRDVWAGFRTCAL